MSTFAFVNYTRFLQGDGTPTIYAYQNNNFAFQATQLAQQHAFQSMEAQASRDFSAWQQQNQNDQNNTAREVEKEVNKKKSEMGL